MNINILWYSSENIYPTKIGNEFKFWSILVLFNIIDQI